MAKKKWVNWWATATDEQKRDRIAKATRVRSERRKVPKYRGASPDEMGDTIELPLPRAPVPAPVTEQNLDALARLIVAVWKEVVR